MIPDFNDLIEKNIFSETEIRSIIKKRREVEFKLRGLDCAVETFLGAIVYEQKLEKLRRKRKKRLGIEKRCDSDSAVISRLHHLFQRGLRKYSTNLQFWWFYFDFAIAAYSKTTLSRAFTRCLELHPQCCEVWLRAANWEFMDNSNIIDARKLLHRGLELNTNNPLLWLGLVKLELSHMRKQKERRIILGQENEPLTKKEQLIHEGILVQEIIKKAFQHVPEEIEFATIFEYITK
eukprot:UN31164